MEEEKVSGSFVDAMTNLEEEKVLELTEERLNSGESPMELVKDVKTAAENVGDKFDKGEYFVVQLMRMGDILDQVMDILEPELEGTREEGSLGRVVIGSAKDDIHNIGKDLVVSLLNANGFEVVDLGVDVPPEKFVEAIKEYEAEVVGMSGLLTAVQDSMKETVEAIEEAGLRDQVKIIVGGGTILDESAREYIGADAYSTSAPQGVKKIKKWVVD